jgi:hypothetical protein
MTLLNHIGLFLLFLAIFTVLYIRDIRREDPEVIPIKETWWFSLLMAILLTFTFETFYWIIKIFFL